MSSAPLGTRTPAPTETRLLEVLNAVIRLAARGCVSCPGCMAWLISAPVPPHLLDCPGEQAIREINTHIAAKR